MLQVALGLRAQRAGAQQAQQFRWDAAGKKAPAHVAGRQPGQFGEPIEAGIDGDGLAEALEQRVLYQLGGFGHRRFLDEMTVAT